ncbi:MAG: hypothetical protein ACOCW3_05320 [Spirochaetota bacterium]
MRRSLIVLGFVVIVPAIVAQDAGPANVEEIDTILELLDAVEAAEAAVLGDGASGQEQLDELEELGRIADTIGADDLAARARSLLVLARPGPEPIPDQPDVDVSLDPPRSDRLVRGSERFRTLTNILGATGATALALSGSFYALAERDYQRWLVADSVDEGSNLFRAWRAYDVLSLAVGGATLATFGLGVPLVYAVALPPSSFATPPGRELYTEQERATRLNELYGERAQIVTALNRYDERGPRRELASTIGLATGIIGTITSAAMYYIAEESYQHYLDAPFSDDAERLGQRVLLFDILAMSSAGMATAGFGTTLGIRVLTSDKQELEQELRTVNRRIVSVRSAPSIDVPERGSVQYVLEPEPDETPTEGDDVE